MTRPFMSQPSMPPGPPTQHVPEPQRQPLPQRGMQPQQWSQQGMQPQPWPHQAMPPGGPSGPVAVQQKPKKAKRFGWPTVIITGVVALGLGTIIGSSGDDTATTAKPDPTVTVPQTPKAEPAPTATKAPEAKKTTEPDSKSTMNEGTYEIGVDAKPGRYKTQVSESSPGCYWARMKDDSGGLNSIIANDNVNPGARVSITVKQGEFFKSDGCGTWTMV
jgi:hypothetical protein